MKAFLIRLWTGEPVFVLGLINTILVTLVATGDMPLWLGWAAAVSTAVSTFVARSQVTSRGENLLGG